MSNPQLDEFGRPVIADEARERIRRAFQGVDGRGAFILLGDTQTRQLRGTWVGKYDNGWKVAAGGGINLTNRMPFAEFAIMKVW